MGDQPFCISAERGHSAGATPQEFRPPHYVDAVWTDVGCHRAQQSFLALALAVYAGLDLLPPAARAQIMDCTGSAGHGRVLDLCDTLAGAELPGIWQVRFHP